jgi:hypothetical protein
VENELTAVFCRSCGEKMNLHAVQADHFDHGGAFSKEGLIRLAKLLVLVLLVGSLGLILWPASASGTKGSNASAQEARAKVQRLRDATKRGAEVTVELSEEEVNGYLTALLYQSKKRNRPVTAGKSNVESINIDLGSPKVSVVVKGKLYGKLPVSYKVKGTPMVGDGTFQFKPSGGSVGHLPMLGPAAKLPIKRVNDVMQGLRNEQAALSGASSMELTSSSVTLQVDAKAE